MVAGDQLIISGGDPQTRDDAGPDGPDHPLRQNDPKAIERYDVIRLKNVTAEEAARIIHEVFNGPPQQDQQRGQQGGRGGGGGFNPFAMLAQFAGAGATAPTDPTAGRVRVVAEKTSNSLIVVKASAAGHDATSGKLLEKAIDTDEPPEGGVMKTYTIALQHARASDLLPVVRGVFQNATGASPGGRTNNRGGGGGRASPFPFPVPGGGGAAAKDPIALSVEADDVEQPARSSTPPTRSTRRSTPW